MGCLYRAQHFLTPDPYCICTNLPFSHVWSTAYIWGGAPRSYGLDRLDRVQKQVVSLVGSGLSSDLQARGMLLASATSITMGNVPLSLWISYLPNVLLVEALAFLSRCIVIQLILLCAGVSFINQAFFHARQPFGTPSPMHAFHQITISHQSRGELSSCC